MGRPNPSREIKFSGANRDREMFIFPVQLTTRKIGNLTRLIHTMLLIEAMTMHTLEKTGYFNELGYPVPKRTIHTVVRFDKA